MSRGMWTILFCVFLLLSPSLLHAQATLEVPSPPVPMGSIAYLDARNGFRDVTFGSSVSKYPGMVLVERDGDMKVYKRPKDDLTLGEGRLQSILYFFYKDQLSEVMLETVGLVNSRAALAVLSHAYGPGGQANQFLETYVWPGQRVGLLYDENPITKDAIMTFRNHELIAKEGTDKNAKAKKAASGL